MEQELLLTDQTVYRKPDAELLQAVVYASESDIPWPAMQMFISPKTLQAVLGAPLWTNGPAYPGPPNSDAAWLVVDEHGGLLCVWHVDGTEYGYRCTSDDLMGWFTFATMGHFTCFERGDLEPDTEWDYPDPHAHLKTGVVQ